MNGSRVLTGTVDAEESEESESASSISILVPNRPNDNRHLSPRAFLAFEVRPTDDVHLAHDLVRHCSELELEVARKREEDGFRLCR